MSFIKGLQFKRLPILVRVLIYLGGNYLLIFLAQFITGFLPIKGELGFNLFLCVLLLIFTGFILKLDGQSWKDIGCVMGNKNDRLHLIGGTLSGIGMLVVTAFIIKLIAGFHWERNVAFQWERLFPLFITIFCSAFVQELAFRGYPFRLVLNKWGEWPAQIIIALLFGLMHLSGNMSPTEILLTMFTTGAGSILFGMAVIKTKRLHLAVGIHFGWNFAQFLVPRAASQNGEGIWIVNGGSFPQEFGYIIWITPYILIAVVAYFIIRKFFLVAA